MVESSQIISAPKKLSKYEQVLLETIETEELYIKDLRSILKNYGEFFDSFDQDKIFSTLQNNLINLLTFATSIFQLFIQNKTDLTKICQIFIDRKEEFAKYFGNYCELFPLANSVIENFSPGSKYRTMIEKCWIESNQSLPLTSYLLKPVQRILKYHLLLKSIESDTTIDISCHTTLALAIEKMKDVGNRINEKQRIHDGYAELPNLRKQIVNLTEPLKFNDVGPVILQETMLVNNKPRRLILFQNVLMIASICENDTLFVKDAFMTDKLFLTEIASKGFLTFSIQAEKQAKRVYLIKAKNDTIKSKWVFEIKSLILDKLGVSLEDKNLSAIFGSECAGKIRCKASVSSLLNIGEILANIDSEDSHEYNQHKTKTSKKMTMKILGPKGKKFDLNAIIGSPLKPSVVKSSSVIKRNRHEKNKPSVSTPETIQTVANVMEVFNRYDQTSDINVEMPWNKEFIQDAANEIKDVLNDDSDKNSTISFDLDIESECYPTSHQISPISCVLNEPEITLSDQASNESTYPIEAEINSLDASLKLEPGRASTPTTDSAIENKKIPQNPSDLDRKIRVEKRHRSYSVTCPKPKYDINLDSNLVDKVLPVATKKSKNIIKKGNSEFILSSLNENKVFSTSTKDNDELVSCTPKQNEVLSTLAEEKSNNDEEENDCFISCIPKENEVLQKITEEIEDNIESESVEFVPLASEGIESLPLKTIMDEPESLSIENNVKELDSCKNKKNGANASIHHLSPEISLPPDTHENLSTGINARTSFEQPKKNINIETDETVKTIQDGAARINLEDIRRSPEPHRLNQPRVSLKYIPKNIVNSIVDVLSASSIDKKNTTSTCSVSTRSIRKASKIGEILMKLQQNYIESQEKFKLKPEPIKIGAKGVPLDELFNETSDD